MDETRETYLVQLWLDNDEGLYRYWRERAQEIWADHGPDQPEDEDWVLESTGYVLLAGNACESLGRFDDRDDALKAIRDRMKTETFYPNVWYRSDHGNIDLMDPHTGEFIAVDLTDGCRNARADLAEEMEQAIRYDDLIATAVPSGLYGDLLTNALGCVEWLDGADSRLEEFEGYEMRKAS